MGIVEYFVAMSERIYILTSLMDHYYSLTPYIHILNRRRDVSVKWLHRVRDLQLHLLLYKIELAPYGLAWTIAVSHFENG